MKTWILLVMAVLLLESCHRSFTPYQAANKPKGKKCGVIK